MQKSWLLVVLAIAGCAGLGSLEQPRLSFVGMNIIEASLFEQRLEVRLRVQNPNDIELPVHGLDIELDLAGEPFASGVSARQFTVPAHGEAEFDMIVTANAAGALLKLASGDRKSRESVEYRLKGKLSTKVGFLRRIPFEERGQLPLAAARAKKEP